MIPIPDTVVLNLPSSMLPALATVLGMAIFAATKLPSSRINPRVSSALPISHTRGSVQPLVAAQLVPSKVVGRAFTVTPMSFKLPAVLASALGMAIFVIIMLPSSRINPRVLSALPIFHTRGSVQPLITAQLVPSKVAGQPAGMPHNALAVGGGMVEDSLFSGSRVYFPFFVVACCSQYSPSLLVVVGQLVTLSGPVSWLNGTRALLIIGGTSHSRSIVALRSGPDSSYCSWLISSVNDCVWLSLLAATSFCVMSVVCFPLGFCVTRP
jgi:hypothetical protein